MNDEEVEQLLKLRDELYEQIKREVEAKRPKYEEEQEEEIIRIKRHEHQRRIKPMDGEIPARVWIEQQARLKHCSNGNIWYQIRRGLYPNIKIRKASRCLAFITEN